MSTLDGVMLFPQSQSSKVHFDNQRVIIMRWNAMSSKLRRFTVRRRLLHRAERQQSQPPDTAGRLLTDMPTNLLTALTSTSAVKAVISERRAPGWYGGLSRAAPLPASWCFSAVLASGDSSDGTGSARTPGMTWPHINGATGQSQRRITGVYLWR